MSSSPPSPPPPPPPAAEEEVDWDQMVANYNASHRSGGSLFRPSADMSFTPPPPPPPPGLSSPSHQQQQAAAPLSPSSQQQGTGAVAASESTSRSSSSSSSSSSSQPAPVVPPPPPAPTPLSASPPPLPSTVTPPPLNAQTQQMSSSPTTTSSSSSSSSSANNNNTPATNNHVTGVRPSVSGIAARFQQQIAEKNQEKEKDKAPPPLPVHKLSSPFSSPPKLVGGGGGGPPPLPPPQPQPQNQNQTQSGSSTTPLGSPVATNNKPPPLPLTHSSAAAAAVAPLSSSPPSSSSSALSSSPPSSSSTPLLAPVMQELSSVYAPYADSATIAEAIRAGKPRASVAPNIKVVVTTPRIRRRLKEPTSAGAGAGAPDAEDEALWDEPSRPPTIWLKFVEAHSGSILYFNTVTNSAQGDRPSDYDGDSDDDYYSDEDVAPPTTTRVRHESTVLESAWDDGAARRAEQEQPENIHTGVVPVDKRDAKTNKQVSVEQFLSSLSLFEKQLDTLLQTHRQSSILPMALEDKLTSLHSQLLDAQHAIEQQDSHGFEARNDVDSLVQFETLSWDFTKNRRVEYYRRCALASPSRPTFSLWHMPSYVSAQPFPPDTKNIQIKIKFPPNDNNQSHTLINVTEQDTCNHVINQVWNKCKGLSPPTEYVLKGTGIADYLYGNDSILRSDYIRSCVRNGNECVMALVLRPAPLAALPQTAEYLESYTQKVDHSIEIVDTESYRDVASKDGKFINLSELHLPFRFKLIGMDNFNETSLPRLEEVTHYYVRLCVFYGCKNLSEPRDTDDRLPFESEPRWNTGVLFKDLVLSSLPRGARLAIMVLGKRVGKPEPLLLAYAAIPLVDERGRFLTGKQSFHLWSLEGNDSKKKHGKTRDVELSFIFRSPPGENLSAESKACIQLQFDEFALPVVTSMTEAYREPNPKIVGAELNLKDMSKDRAKQWEILKICDVLKELTPDDYQMLWNYRHHLVKTPSALAKFLQAVNWCSAECRNEAHRLLKVWATPTRKEMVQIIELLDAKYPDPIVREYAITLLRQFTDDEVRIYLLQLVQCLKFENYHDSPLKRFLIERALQNPMHVGHYFFWHLKAEMTDVHCCERFACILEEYLTYADRFTHELKKQSAAVLKLQRVAEMVVRLKRDHGYSDPEAMQEYTKELAKLNSDFFAPMGKFQLPLDPKIEVTQLVVEKCRYMSSKMVPLWLVFKNADIDAPNVYVIFKSGDDLRQDILTLQVLSIMDALWLDNGLDCKMRPYKCIATGVNEHGDGVGMIEVVLNSDTTSGIQLKYGGGAMGALKMEPLDLFLKDHNNPRTGKDYNKAVDNFVRSCAGYCVATFVLGIGDRHNGNIMVTKDGHLFHIDFGHFLGNFKKKFGVNRERAAFVFTPEMAYVMGGSKYKSSALFKEFKAYSTRAFLTLRIHANLLETLFLLMVSAGMPELMKEVDIHYMRDKLYLTDLEKKAEKKLLEEIDKSLDSTYRRIDNFIHNMKHK